MSQNTPTSTEDYILAGTGAAIFAFALIPVKWFGTVAQDGTVNVSGNAARLLAVGLWASGVWLGYATKHMYSRRAR